ncbi:RNA polymerase II elongation factor ELL2-like [Melozone crissalis]|uniref:RNA polymerase II elongation factor ELL2-like n=1 Tax=Melozone crissalis TaxID=40204 RepID=UPI0023D97B21|nr:RNA polymerase II elongation factor ELL2-like [Melozone crissalis]
MAELRAWAGSSEFRRAPICTASCRAPTSTAMPVRVSQRCQEQQDKRVKLMKPGEREENPCSAVYQRPYRDRVIHLVALRTYKKPELLARLQRDGVMQKDKGSLAKILQQAAKWNAKDNSFSLKEHLFQTLQTDWTDYPEIDRQNLKLILSGDQPDYLRKYIAIVSLEERQSYKADFNAEYEEYRNLHSAVDKTIKKFRRFQEQRKSLTPGSESYQMLNHRIRADYQQLQQGSPSYSEMKSRCLYLHKKLAHIQSCISEFDQL